MDFVRACTAGDVRAVQQHFARGGDRNLQASNEASTALHFAVTHGTIEAISTPRGVATDGGDSFLDLGSRNGAGQYEIVELLLDQGVSVNAPNPHGTPWASWPSPSDYVAHQIRRLYV